MRNRLEPLPATFGSDPRDLEDLIFQALLELDTAKLVLTLQTTPRTPLPRPRVFSLIARGDQEVVFPHGPLWRVALLGRDGVMKEYEIRFENPRFDLAVRIVEMADGMPRRVLRALRRIQAATAWCEARAAGRARAAAEILQQQRLAVEVLEVEAAATALGKGF